MVAGDLRNGAHLGLTHDNGIAGHMAEAGAVAFHSGVEDLHRLILRHRSGDNSGLAACAVEEYIHLAFGILAAVGQKLFLNEQFGIFSKDGLGIALGIIHTFDLDCLQGHAGALFQIQNGLRVQNALAAAFAFAVVLFNIRDFGVFAHMEGVDAIVGGVAVAAVVNTAACHDLDIGAFADEKVVIYHIVAICFRHDHRNVDIFFLGKGFDIDIDAIFIQLGFDGDIFCISAEGFLAVGTDVDRALLRDLGKVSHFLQNAFLDVIQHFLSTSSMLQPATTCAMIWLYMSPAGPLC